MYLNLFILSDYIKYRNQERFFHTNVMSCPLKSAALFDPDTEWSRDKLYILSVTDFFRCRGIPSRVNLLLVPDQELDDEVVVLLKSKFQRSGADILLLRDTATVSQVLNEVLDVFQFFNDWQIRMNQCFLCDDVIQALGVCALEVLCNPFTLADSAFRMLYNFEKPKPNGKTWFAPEDKGSYLSDYDINELLLDPAFIHSWETNGPQFYPPEEKIDFCLYENIGIENRYVARVVLCYIDNPYRESDKPLLHYLCQLITKALGKSQIPSLNAHPANLDETILKLSKMKKAPPWETIQPVMERMHWEQDDTWFCCKILSPADSAVGSVANACFRLEDSIRGSCAVQNNESILLLINLRQAKKERGEVISEIVHQVREFILTAGISLEFNDLTRLRDYYQQADIALRIGKEQNSMQWSFRFEDFNLLYLTEQCIKSLDPHSLCHPGLLRLMDYDKNNGRKYAAVLRIYLENDRNIAETVRKAYMQRATFLYQLNRIKEISGVDFDDHNVRFHFLLSYRMLDLANVESISAPDDDASSLDIL